jgi:hypothetical protein
MISLDTVPKSGIDYRLLLHRPPIDPTSGSSLWEESTTPSTWTSPCAVQRSPQKHIDAPRPGDIHFLTVMVGLSDWTVYWSAYHIP